MKEVDAQIVKSHIDDYTRILPVYPDISDGTRSTIKGGLEEVIKKASLIKEKHKNSKWLDDSYIIIGKAYYYKHDYKTALAFFKYVNSKSEEKDARHAALILLLRTYTDSADYMSAKSVCDYLEKKEKAGETFTPDNSRDYHLAKACYHQKLRQYDQMLPELIKALPDIKKKDQRARINFIIGQLTQMQQQDTTAYKHYRASTKRNPPYDLLFHAKLYMTQVASGAGSDKKMDRYFKRLLADRKNAEYKDKIYYEMGNYELKKGNTPKAITNYEKSLEAGTKNIPQKAQGYLKLGEVYYDKEAYMKARFYYDSAVAIWDQKDPLFRQISTRQKILVEFADYTNTVQREDSLQRLSKMSKDQLDRLIDDIIALEQEKKEKEKLALEKKAASNQNNIPATVDNTNTNSTFALTNPQAIDQGKKEFAKIWGNRKLEDNWRRSQREKEFVTNIEPDGVVGNNEKEEEKEVKEEEVKINKDIYYKDIPFTQAQLDTSNKRIEKSLYHIGKIYNQKLDEPEKSVRTFDELFRRFPDSEYTAEAYYLVYLIYQNKLNNTSKADPYKTRLFNEYPNSLYAKLLKNPNYLKESKESNMLAHARYKEAYDLYKSGDYKQCESVITSITVEFPENDINDKIALLRILITGQTTNAYLYKHQLQTFIDEYGSSPLLPKAKELLASADQFMEQKNKMGQMVTSKDVKFSTDLNKPHLLVMVVPASTAPEKFTKDFASYNKGYEDVPNLLVNNQQFNDTLRIIVVKGFGEKFPAQLYLSKLKSEKSFYEKNGYSKHPTFIITDHNFQLFVDSKIIESYLKFFKENY